MLRTLLHNICLLGILFTSAFAAQAPSRQTSTDGAPTSATSGNFTMPFTRNVGQWSDDILFRADAGNAVLWICKNGIIYQFLRTEESDRAKAGTGVRGLSIDGRPASVESQLVTAKFVGANADVEITELDQLNYRCNYFRGDDPTQWRTDVPNYGTVVMHNLYPDVDLKFFTGSDGQVACEFTAPTAMNLARVKVDYSGAVTSVKSVGGVQRIETVWGEILNSIQPKASESSISAPLFPAARASTLEQGAALGQHQAEISGLLMPYSTYLGGGGNEDWPTIALDNSGDMIVVGSTSSVQLEGGISGLTQDIFLTKFSGAGGDPIFTTVFGSPGVDGSDDIALDDSGYVYITGRTNSSGFPTVNPIDATFNGGNYDVFVTKIAPTGSALIYSTYLGSDVSEAAKSICVDHSGCAYISGHTSSPDFPTQNAFDQTLGGLQDAFIAKLSASGSALIWSTFLGGSDSEELHGDLAIDDSNYVYLAGSTRSSDFPTVAAYDSTFNGGADQFLTRLSAAGDALLFSTFLGGSGDDLATSLQLDGSGNIYVVGAVGSSDFPLQNAFDSTMNGGVRDVSVTKLTSAGDSLLYSTYIGGSSDDVAHDAAVDIEGSVHFTGYTMSSDYPTKYALDSVGDPFFGDAIVTKLSPSGNALVYSTLLGSSFVDDASGITLDSSGFAYIVGSVRGYDFPVRNAHDVSYAGNGDAFISKLKLVSVTCGDANGSGSVSISDVVYILAYIFSGGPAPDPSVAGDVDCNSVVTISDVVYLIRFIFAAGPDPCAACQ